MATRALLRTLTTIVLLAALVSSTPLWLRRDRSEDAPPKSLNTRAELADYILPQNLRPQEYDIKIIPYLETPETKKFTFDGTVSILCFVQVATDTIKLHAFDMDIDQNSITVTHIGGISSVNVIGMTVSPADDDRNFLEIKLEKALGRGTRYYVKMNFVGKLNDALEGFYRSSYTGADGTTKWLAVTQFESAGARRAFPCFDEPTWKAKITVRIAHAPGFTALSNMPVNKTEPLGIAGLDDWELVSFSQSVVMPTYLVAFTVNQFDSITNAEDARYKAWARPEAVNQANFGNDLAPHVVQYMETYTGHDYSLPKMDQIAIPDFESGAMENWGLVTYRESALLFEEGVSGSSNRQRIETVVTHELAHQWFGNIVTLKWWDNIWLNEGFATYFEYHALANIQDTWHLEEQFVYEQMHSVLQSDALESTHPLLAPNAVTPYETNSVFDSIAYNKGGCMVRLLVSLLGEDHFKMGINEYITANAFGNANMDDLWAALEPHVPEGVLTPDLTLKAVMDTWSLQSGYPVVTVTRNYNSQRAIVTQNRFVTLPTSVHLELWDVPLTMTSQASPDFDDVTVVGWHRGGQHIISDVPATAEQWVIFNNKQVGYYRVNYDATNWGLLASALNDHSEMSKIHVVNRGQLMDDALALARAGLLDYQTALGTTEYLGHEAEYHPWRVGLSGLSYLHDRMNLGGSELDNFQWYMRLVLGPAYSLVKGFAVGADDSHVLRLQRALVTRWACRTKHATCNSEAAALFKKWQDKPEEQNPIDPDLKSVVYCAGMSQGGQAQYDFLFARYEASAAITDEQSLIVTALGCASTTAILNTYLQASITTGSAITGRGVFTAVYGNPLGVDPALDFIIANWEAAKEFYGGETGVGRAFTGIASKLNTKAQHDKLQAFLAANDEASLGAIKASVESAMASLETTLDWHAANGAHVVDYVTVKREEAGDSGAAAFAPLLLLTLAVSVLVTRV